MSGDPDEVLAKRGVEPNLIHITHAVQDTVDDIIATVSRQMAPPKDPKKARGVSFSEAIPAGHDALLPLTSAGHSPATDIRQPQITIVSTMYPERSLHIDHLNDQPAPSTAVHDHMAPQIVDEENLSRAVDSCTVAEKPAMIVSAGPLHG